MGISSHIGILLSLCLAFIVIITYIFSASQLFPVGSVLTLTSGPGLVGFIKIKTRLTDLLIIVRNVISASIV